MVFDANPYPKYAITNVLQQATRVGLNVVRTWAFNDGNDYNMLQTSPNVFNKNMFQGLDFVILKAKRLGIRLIFNHVNNNPSFGEKQQYVQWARQY
jgi:mannan endo-1,4-beta-mannosidase